MELPQLQQGLRQLATSEAREAARKFVPDVQRVYGIRMPLLNALARELKNEITPAFIQTLWQSGAFEEKVLAAKLIGKIAKKHPETSLRMVDEFSLTIHDWVVCDTLGMQSLKPIAASHQKEIFALAARLNRSENLWQRRLSLVLVEVFTKQPGLHPQINLLIQNLHTDREYYVKKAVAWLKRNMAQ